MDTDGLKNRKMDGIMESEQSLETTHEPTIGSTWYSNFKRFRMNDHLKPGLYDELNEKYGDDNISWHEHLNTNIDWNTIFQQAYDGYIIFDPVKLTPLRFVQLMNMLEEDYARHCVNWLISLDDDLLQRNLHDMPDFVVMWAHSEAVGIRRRQQTIIERDERCGGAMSDEEYEELVPLLHRNISVLTRIVSAAQKKQDERMNPEIMKSAKHVETYWR